MICHYFLSKNTIQKANTAIDFQNDQVSMFGKFINLKFTTSGHYVILLNTNCRVNEERKGSINICCSNTEKIKSADTDEKQRIATKLHKQFSRAGGERLKKLLYDGDITDKEMLRVAEEVAENCGICKRFK